jgi:hypothetical protein
MDVQRYGPWALIVGNCGTGGASWVRKLASA